MKKIQNFPIFQQIFVPGGGPLGGPLGLKRAATEQAKTRPNNSLILTEVKMGYFLVYL